MLTHSLIKNMAPQSQRWCFTHNNYSDADQAFICQLFASSDFKYGVYGRETGDSGTPHLQGFFILKKRVRLSTALALFGDLHPHLEATRGTSLQASDYCKKDGDFEEVGSCPSPGERNEFAELKHWILEHPTKPTAAHIAREFPQLFLKYGRIMEWVDAIYPKPELESGDPRPWQQALKGKLEVDADDRSIIFVVDETGGSGKSWFSRWWYSLYPEETQLLGVGKRDDLAHAVSTDKQYFFFDIPRTQLQYFQYSILEQLKNRIVFSPKYSSRVKVLDSTPHVVVFTNEEPDRDVLTADRYDIMFVRNL